MDAHTTAELSRHCRALPFEAVYQVGFPDAWLDRLVTCQKHQERLGASVFLLGWPDTTWCVVATKPEQGVPLLLLGEWVEDAFEQARSMIAEGWLPMLIIGNTTPNAT